MERPSPELRDAYSHFLSIPTRWADNDVYGHVNNTVYYSYFDTVVNQYLIGAQALDPIAGEVIGLVVETHCLTSANWPFPTWLMPGCGSPISADAAAGFASGPVASRFAVVKELIDLAG